MPAVAAHSVEHPRADLRAELLRVRAELAAERLRAQQLEQNLAAAERAVRAYHDDVLRSLSP